MAAIIKVFLPTDNSSQSSEPGCLSEAFIKPGLRVCLNKHNMNYDMVGHLQGESVSGSSSYYLFRRFLYHHSTRVFKAAQ